MTLFKDIATGIFWILAIGLFVRGLIVPFAQVLDKILDRLNRISELLYDQRKEEIEAIKYSLQHQSEVLGDIRAILRQIRDDGKQS